MKNILYSLCLLFFCCILMAGCDNQAKREQEELRSSSAVVLLCEPVRMGPSTYYRLKEVWRDESQGLFTTKVGEIVDFVGAFPNTHSEASMIVYGCLHYGQLSMTAMAGIENGKLSGGGMFHTVEKEKSLVQSTPYHPVEIKHMYKSSPSLEEVAALVEERQLGLLVGATWDILREERWRVYTTVDGRLDVYAIGDNIGLGVTPFSRIAGPVTNEVRLIESGSKEAPYELMRFRRRVDNSWHAEHRQQNCHVQKAPPVPLTNALRLAAQTLKPRSSLEWVSAFIRQHDGKMSWLLGYVGGDDIIYVEVDSLEQVTPRDDLTFLIDRRQ